MGFGIVGGPLFSFEGAGKTAADLALRVMAGESPATIPFYQPRTPTRSYTTGASLKRWGIPEKRLPPGSTVLYKRVLTLGVLPMVHYRHPDLLSRRVIPCCAPHAQFTKPPEGERELADSETRYRTVADYTYDWEYWSAPDGSSCTSPLPASALPAIAPKTLSRTLHVSRRSSFPKTGRSGMHMTTMRASETRSRRRFSFVSAPVTARSAGSTTSASR